MAGLGVLLEPQFGFSKCPQVISKITALSSNVSPSPRPPPLSAASGSFLDSCFLCGKQLSQGNDIYMYRGDRAFCSVECRCRHIAMDDEESVRREKCGGAASRRREKAARKARPAAGGFVY